MGSLTLTPTPPADLPLARIADLSGEVRAWSEANYNSNTVAYLLEQWDQPVDAGDRQQWPDLSDEDFRLGMAAAIRSLIEDAHEDDAQRIYIRGPRSEGSPMKPTGSIDHKRGVVWLD